MDGAPEVAERLLVQPRPYLAARLPHHLAIRAARITQRHNEQPRPTVAAAVRMAGERAFAVVDLALLPREELQAVELLRLLGAQRPTEALDAVVALRAPGAGGRGGGI